MSKITVVLSILVTVLLSACGSKPPNGIVITPSNCTVMAGEQIGLAVSGTFPNDTEIEWETSNGVIKPTDSGYAAVFTAPSQPVSVTITVIVITGKLKTPKSLECQILPLPATEIPPATQTPIPTATEILLPTLTLTPAPACDQLSIEDFKLISPSGLHGPQTVGSKIPQLLAHAPVAWEPSYCPLTIKVFLGGVLVREYKSYNSGSIDTAFIMNDTEFKGKKYVLKSGDWIEIKIWVEGKSLPSDNVHLLLP